jgi:hypothetical protein
MPSIQQGQMYCLRSSVIQKPERALQEWQQQVNNCQHGEVVVDKQCLIVKNKNFLSRKFKTLNNSDLTQSARKFTLLSFKKSVIDHLCTEYQLPRIKAKHISAHMFSDRHLDKRGYVKAKDIQYFNRHIGKYKNLYDLLDQLRPIATDKKLIQSLNDHHPGIGSRLVNALRQPDFWINMIPLISSVSYSLKAALADEASRSCEKKLMNTSDVHVLRKAILTTLQQYYTDKRNTKLVLAISKPLLFIITALTGGIALAAENSMMKGVTLAEPLVGRVVTKGVSKLVESSTHQAFVKGASHITQQVQHLVRESSPVPSELRKSTELVHPSKLSHNNLFRHRSFRVLFEMLGLESSYKNTLADANTCRGLLEYLEGAVHNVENIDQTLLNQSKHRLSEEVFFEVEGRREDYNDIDPYPFKKSRAD